MKPEMLERVNIIVTDIKIFNPETLFIKAWKWIYTYTHISSNFYEFTYYNNQRH